MNITDYSHCNNRYVTSPDRLDPNNFIMLPKNYITTPLKCNNYRSSLPRSEMAIFNNW